MEHDRSIAWNSCCIHEAFEHVASRSGDREAVICGDTRLTYCELNKLANRYAHVLLASGLRREEPVAIALPRSAAQIAAMLGVLKAGGAYVPIVDNQPIARLKQMIEDAQPRYMIGEHGYLDELHGITERVIFAQDSADQLDSNPDLICQNTQLAYIMYTSGSTGEPKGVMIEHEGVLRLVHDQWFMPTGPHVNYLCVSSFGFDASTIEVYASLLHGAKLVISAQRVPEPAVVAQLIRDEDIRAAWIAFGFFGSLFEADPSLFEPVQVVMTGGEPVSAELIRRAQRALPATRFVNSYGPTECTALSTAYEIPPLEDAFTGLLPIGRSLRGMSCRVVDAEGHEVGVNQEGELLISGIGIARGYLHAPELTDARFQVNNEGQREYRSGDLVRLQPDGEVMFLGRIDSQVKLRGNRFELGEVEVVARRHSSVRSCIGCVIDTNRGQQLALLLTGKLGSSHKSALRAFMAEHLPEYMVPTVMVSVQSIPLTQNGKADRREATRLIKEHQSIDTQQCGSDSSGFETQTQAQLAALMSDVLECDVTCKEDRFLDLGGHSLRAMVLISRIWDQFGLRLAVSSVYVYPSVARLAEHIDQQRQLNSTPGEDERIQSGDIGDSPLSFNQLRLWMLDQINPGDPSYTISLRLEHHSPINRGAFNKAWDWLCARHDTLRARICIVDSSPMQIISNSDAPVWRDAQSVSQSEIAALIAREAARGFDLEVGPLVRCVVYDRGDSATIMISMHHIISDGWSCEILQRELDGAYTELSAGRSPESAPLPVRYGDYARWERGLPDRKAYHDDLAYWTEQLQGSTMLRLPSDYAQRVTNSSAGTKAEFTIEPDLLEAIRAAAKSQGVTTFIYLLAIFKVWLHRLTLEEDIVLGTPIANRERTEIEGLIGFFMETLAIRNTIKPEDTFETIIARVSKSTFDAFDHRDVPFQHIVESLNLQGSSEHNPLFEVFFNHIAIRLYDNEHNDEVLRFSENQIDNQTAKFDLTCYIYEQQDSAQVVFNARKSRFSPFTNSWYLEQFSRLLRVAHLHLQTPISNIPLPLDPVTSPHPARVPAPQLPVHITTSGSITDRISIIVRDHPRRTAVRTTESQISYEEIWSAAGRLAARLQKDGVKPAERVLLCTTDPIATSIAVLGTLRSGAVFVPTDPSWPDERIRKITEISRACAVITDQSVHGYAGNLHVIHAEQDELNALLNSNPTDPNSPAYMMFTSGSTGIPKGVVQTHRGVVGHMQTFAHSIALSPSDELLQLSSFAFDASIMDMFACWFTGATLCVAQPSTSSPQQLAQWIDEQGIHVVHGAPTLLRWFTGAIAEQMTMPSVQTVVSGGEPATDHDLDAILSAFPNCERFINGLGLTESSLNLQYRVDPREITNPTSIIPVGFPVEGTTMRLVDAMGNPTGPSGEIEMCSDRIAAEYIAGPDELPLTIGDPIDDQHRHRFRTGDLATVRHDGSLMHLRRSDDQVQVRGCRIEPREVASAIRTLKCVQDAAVLAVSLHEGGHELCAYVECEENCTQHQLMSLLAEELPKYMIPTHWARVDQIPRMGGGKLDHNKLRNSKTSLLGNPATCEPGAETEQSRVIARAFAQVLELNEITLGDHFFRMGGNSLKAIKLFTILREQLNIELPISIIYRAPTPIALDIEISKNRMHSVQSEALIELTHCPDARKVIVLPGIGGHPLGFAPLIDRIETPLSFLGVQYPDEPTLDQIGREMPAMAQWVIEQLNLKPEAPVPDIIGYSFGGSLGTEVAMQLIEAGHSPGNLILLDAHLPFGLPKKGKFGSARAHLACIVEGHETSRLGYIGKRLRIGAGARPNSKEAHTSNTNDGDRIDLQRYRAVARINRQMVLDYRPTHRYEAPVLLLRAKQPEWLRFHHDDGFNGFSAIIDPAVIRRVDIDAAHLDLFQPEPASRIAQSVDQWLGAPVL